MRPKRRAPGLVQAVVSISLALAATQAWAGSKYAVLHNFDYGMKDQIGPPGGPPALDAAGNLYGGAGGGVGCGGYGCGLIYRLRPRGEGGWALSVVYEFMGGSGGSFPQQVMFDDAGDLYGTLAGDGGAAVAGVYELARKDAKWDFSMLYSPGGCCLVLGGAGRVYGAIGAGKYGSGEVSELLHGSKGWVLKTLYSFCNPQSCPDGDGPVAPLTWDSRGNLYGTALYGGNGPPKCPGSLGCGVAFQMTPNSNGTWKYHVLHRFAAFSYDGRYPYAGLVVDASGNVYGATYLGGSHGNGTIFKLTRSSSGQWTQQSFFPARPDHRPTLSSTLAGGIVLPLDQTAPAHQGFLRHLGERCQDSNVGCALRLRPGRDRQKAAWARPEPLPNSPNSQRHDFRKNPDFTGVLRVH